LALAVSGGLWWALLGSGWLLLALVGSGWRWWLQLALVGFGWPWLALVGADWRWLALVDFVGSGWLCSALVGAGRRLLQLPCKEAEAGANVRRVPGQARTTAAASIENAEFSPQFRKGPSTVQNRAARSAE